jgi:DNA polymerase-3 subunit epsilon/CBS domain-containing protein
MIVLDFLAGIWRRLAVGDSTPLDALLDPGFVAIDVETTGLNPRRDAIVAVAAIPFEAGRSRPGFVTLVNPRRPIPAQSTAIHGINDAAVATAPSIVEVLPRFDSVCTRRIVIGHDVAFDVAVLEQSRTTNAGLSPRLTLDTRQLARALGYRDTRLEVLAPQLHVPVVGRHTAEGDARMAGEIMLGLLPALRGHGVRTLGDLIRLQRSAPVED